MLATFINRIPDRHTLWTDLLIVVCLIGLDVAARLLPHAPDFTPIAATALFAATMLRRRGWAVLAPVAGMLLGDAALGLYDFEVMIVVYAALSLPACIALLSRRLDGWLIATLLLTSSLIFFVVTNFAVWAFSPIYPATADGLCRCYIAALPFLRNMFAGDVFWGILLFGLYGLWNVGSTAKGEDLPVRAVTS